MTQSQPHTAPEPTLRQTLREDLQKGGLGKSLRREYQELKEMFLTEGRREKLASMNLFKRSFWSFGWLLKELILRLNTTRRLLLLLGLLLILVGPNIQVQDGDVQTNSSAKIIGAVVLVFVLALELKDKLLAKDELLAGRAVQHALMPEREPAIPGWEAWLMTRPANDVGGDLLDCVDVGGGSFFLALGDVSGKGLGAALLMAKLQATLRALLGLELGLAEIGRRLNEIFTRDKFPTSFASVVGIRLEPGSARIGYINAGHLPPVLIRPGGVRLLPKGGPGLGVVAETSYEEESVVLDPGEIFLVYSDGLTDARNAQGAFYGDQRLEDLFPRLAGLTARQAGEFILAQVEAYMGEARQHDDLSLILLRRRGS